MLKNPFYIYMLTFGGALAIYQLGWAEVYPDLSIGTLAFFALTFVLATGFGLAVSREVATIGSYRPGRMPWYAVLVVVAGAVADLVHNGEVPLLEMLNDSFLYGSFVGVRSLHVFTATFGSAFATIRFADFLYEKSTFVRLRYLIEATIPIVYFALIVYRGPVLIILVYWAFVFVISRGIRPISGAAIAAAAAAALYIFGVWGEARNDPSDSLGRPTEAFVKTMPRSYFGSYLYATGPLANLQYAVKGTNPIYRLDLLPQFFVGEMLPDFISNRALPLMGAKRLTVPEMSTGFNVSTMFGRSYLFFGWAGALATFAWLSAIAFFYLKIIVRSPYSVPCLALLNTLIVFSLFDNMIAHTGMSVPLIWPLLLALLPPPAKFEASADLEKHLPSERSAQAS